ncbi:unnamed protein product, partial [Hydatigera taeniaeformis]
MHSWNATLTFSKKPHNFKAFVLFQAVPPPTNDEQYPTLAPKPVPAPTTPSIRPIYPLPEENLFSKFKSESIKNVSYLATTNHYWTFSTNSKWITDQAPIKNFLTKSLYERFDSLSMDNVAAKIKDDFGKTPGSLFTPLDTMDGFVGTGQIAKGLFPEDTPSVRLTRQSGTMCFKLVPDLGAERPYFRACITDPEKSDRFEIFLTPIPTPPPPTDHRVDYSRLVDEYQPRSWFHLPTNPYYTTADGYFELNTEPNSGNGCRDVKLLGNNCRSRGSYKLDTINAYCKLKNSLKTTCPGNFSMCQSGFSIGAWISVPSTLNANKKPMSLFEVAGYIKVALFGDFLHLLVFDGRSWRATRIIEAVTRGTVFNVGFSISEANHLASGFINGLSVQTMIFASQKPDKTNTHGEVHDGDIILGSKDVGWSAEGVAVGDLVYWNRITLPHEGHRFVGYTASQVQLLSNANHYWSTDAYVLHDAPCRLAFERKRQQMLTSDESIPNYRLASIYKPVGLQPVRYILDQDKRSLAPILSMRKNDYFMLGRRKQAVPTQADLEWLDHCLHAPSKQTCGVKGVTLSIWLSLQSVSDSRIRYIFNSGNPGTSEISAVRDGHGWAIFTRRALLGASVSTTAGDWTLLLDSKSYKLGQWLNLGITWNTNVGLKLFVNGIDLNMPPTKPKTHAKGYEAPPHLLVGRFDTDDLSSCLTPAEAEAETHDYSLTGIPVFWEMAHFALSEVAYIDKYMTPHEYALNFGFLGNEMIQKNSKHVWYGAELLDPSIADLLLASQMNIPRQSGPYAMHNASTLSVQYEEDRRVVILDQTNMLRLGPLSPVACPGNASECTNGFTIGGWYSLIPDVDGMAHANFSSPLVLLTGNGGKMGIALTDGGYRITGWMCDVACSGPSEVLIATSHHNQWFHVALSWLDNEIYLFLNGNRISKCVNTSETKKIGEKIFSTTGTNPAYLAVVAPPHQDIGYRLAVAIVNIWDTCVDSEFNIGDFMGLSRAQKNYFSRSTIYWPMSGLLTHLAPSRIITSDIERAKDMRNVEGGALCTKSTHGSYIVLTGDHRPGGNYSNLYYSCLYDANQCHELLLIVNFRLNAELKMEDQEFVILKTPPEGNAAGIEISINPMKEMLKLTRRKTKSKCSLSVNLGSAINTLKEWTNLQVSFSDQDLRLYLNEEFVSV